MRRVARAFGVGDEVAEAVTVGLLVAAGEACAFRLGGRRAGELVELGGEAGRKALLRFSRKKNAAVLKEVEKLMLE